MNDIPWAVVGPLIAVVVLVDVLLLVDLARREVTGLPKAAWALVIVVVSFPVGALVYWFVGRVPPTDAVDRLDELPAPTVPEGRTVHTGLPTTDTVWEPEGPLALATYGLRKEYDLAAVADVELRVPRGATYGLIGPNGAGKTTLLGLVAQLRRPTAGRVELAVERRRMAVLPDTPRFEPWLTGREVVELARHLADPRMATDRVTAALAEVELLDAADRRTGGYSRGMLQRLGLATCLVGDPSVLLLDEPSAALDPAGRREVLDLIGRLAGDRTVVFSTHVLADVQQVCDVVGVLRDGRLVFQGPLEQLLARTSSVYRLRAGAGTDLVPSLSAAPWVTGVEREGNGGYRLAVSDVAAAERGIAGVLAAAGARLHTFGPATDLETAFLELTEGDR